MCPLLSSHPRPRGNYAWRPGRPTAASACSAKPGWRQRPGCVVDTKAIVRWSSRRLYAMSPGQPVAGQGPLTRPAGALRRLGLEHSLDLKVEVDLVGDYDAAALDGRIPGHAEVCPVDLAGRGKTCPCAAVSVWPETVEFHLQRHAAGNALQSQLPVKHVAVAVGAQSG